MIGESCVSTDRLSPSSYEGYRIVPFNEDHLKEVRWSNYLFDHLSRRIVAGECIVLSGESNKNLLTITVEIDTLSNDDFEVQLNRKGVQLTARDDEKMLWLIYQLIGRLGASDSRLTTSDLPPSIVSFQRDTCGQFAFDYRGIYSPSNQNVDYRGIVSTHNVEEGWGLWGHQLDRLFKENAPKEVFALIKEQRTKEQYCFSSPTTYQTIHDYIVDQYGTGDKVSTRFVISPADNALVCQCKTCVAQGNTATTATPAVAKLTVQLAKDFPKHEFFFLSYLTTTSTPTQPLPSNVGAIVSAIDLRFVPSFESTPSAKEFTASLQHWQSVTKKVYVWDYINNFDDYLSPFPVLGLMKSRLQWYQNNGVQGMFLNGSGYDYCAFGDLYTFIFAALLIDPSQNTETLIRRYYADQYPTHHKLLSDYVCELEQTIRTKKVELSLYGSSRSAEKSYLDATMFVAFYDRLVQAVATSKDEERAKLNKLLTALSYTRMELARNAGISTNGLGRIDQGKAIVRPQVAQWTERLEDGKSFADLKHISESELTISDYLHYYSEMTKQFVGQTNLLHGTKIAEYVSKEDADRLDWSLLNDGVNGLTVGYHYGWCLSPKEIKLDLPVEITQKAQRIRMQFLNNPRHRIYPPQRVILYKETKFYKELTPSATQSDSLFVIDEPINGQDGKKMSIRIECKSATKSQMGLDEIYLLPK